MASVRLGSDKYQFESHWFDSTRVRNRKVQIQTDLPEGVVNALLNEQPRLVEMHLASLPKAL